MKGLLFITLLCSLFHHPGNSQSTWIFTYQNDTAGIGLIHAINSEKVLTTSSRGLFFLSQDGAQTFEKIQLDSNESLYGSIQFINPDQGFVGGGCFFTTDLCLGNVVATTSDGGSNWAIDQISNSFGVIEDLSVLSDGTIYALSSYDGLYRKNPLTGVWDSLGKPSHLPYVHFTGIHFFDSNLGLVEYWKNFTDKDTSYLARTEDGGVNWELIDKNPTQIYGKTHFFINPQIGFKFGDNGFIARTSDGGNTWSNQQIFPINEFPGLMKFVNTQVGHFSTFHSPTSSGKLYRTTDGGNTWLVDLAFDSTYISDFHFSDEETGYLSSGHTKVWKRIGQVNTSNPNPGIIASVYPNPATETLVLTFVEQQKQASFQINGAWGNLCMEGTIPAGQHTTSIDVSRLANGLYWLTIDNSMAVKFVVQR